MRHTNSLFPFYRWENWDTEIICNLPKATHKWHSQDLNPGSLTSLHSNVALRRSRSTNIAKGMLKKLRTEKRRVQSTLRQKWKLKHKKLKNEKTVSKYRKCRQWIQYTEFKSCGRQNHTQGKEEFANLIKDFVWGDYAGWNKETESHHQALRAETFVAGVRQRCSVAGSWKGHEAKNMATLEAGKVRETNIPWRLQKKHSPANNLI